MADSNFQLWIDGLGVTARLTPWDRRALGYGTAEIVALRTDSTADAVAMLERVEAWARQCDVRYLFGRVSADAGHLRRAFMDSGHVMVECSVTLSRDGFAGLPVIPTRLRPSLRPAHVGDLDWLRAMACEDFHHGRFLEDPAIDHVLATRRTANWVGDLVEQGLLSVAESGGRVIGFHAERLSGETGSADLILTGVARRYSMLALPLWVVALERLAEGGMSRCTTLVSAANTGVMNLYAKLGFRCDSTLFGYRKFL